MGLEFKKTKTNNTKQLLYFSAPWCQPCKQFKPLLESLQSEMSITFIDVEISSQDIPGWLVANANGITVALDITITEDLRKEGIARELVNRIQNLRKDSGFEVTDKIKVQLEKNGNLEEAITANLDYVQSETLTKLLVFEDKIENGTEIEFDDIKTKIIISK